MEDLTNCFGVQQLQHSCVDCKRFLPLQQDDVMRMYFVAPPAAKMVVDTITCSSYINNAQQGASNA